MSKKQAKTTSSKPKGMKEKIVGIALDLFSSHGYDSISTTEIAQQAGISQPNIHYYFKTKEALWKAAVEELGQKIRDASFTAVNPRLLKQMDPLSALKLFMSMLHTVSREVPEVGKIIHLEGQAGGKRLDWLIKELIMPNYQIQLALIEDCIEQKLIKPYAPHQILILLHSAAVSYYNLAPLIRSAFDADPMSRRTSAEFSDLYIDALFSGLELKT